MSYDDSWFDRAKAQMTVDVAFPGIKWAQRSGPQWRSRCPIHGGRNDTSFSVNIETLVFRCHSCGRGGDPLTFAWQMQTGSDSQPRGRDAYDLMVELASRVGMAPPGRSTRESVWERNPPPARRPDPEPEYPPTADVWRLWRIGERPSVGAADVLEAWGVDAAAVDDEIRVLPPGLEWTPSWARIRGVLWGISGYEILFPLRDATMRARSYVARSLDPSRLQGLPKSTCPAGYSPKGLVMANKAARDAIRTGECPRDTIVVREGDRDWLFEAQHGLPVIGTRAGAWSDVLTRVLPRNITLVIATDPDATGEKYREVIEKSIVDCERFDITPIREVRPEAA
jgi:hypothetical protein